MSVVQNCTIRSTYSKWLFAALSLLSFFTFSGFIAQTKTTLNKPQTTLVVSSSLRQFKSINYKRALISLRSKDLVVPILTDISRLYSQQVKIRITTLISLYILRQTGLFYRPRITSQNADDDSALILA
jgi:hypothetical protein